MADPFEMSLFDVENLEAFPKVREMKVAAVSQQDVQEFARRYHYTETGGNMTWRWGLWHGAVLHGVVSYNLPTRSACESVFGSEHFDKVWHMGRLILSENSPRNSESRLIGGSLRAIQMDYQNVWGVLTYAATDVGHVGYVYQATNAIYTGLSSTEYFYIDPAGVRRSNYLGGRRVKADRAEAMGWSRRDGAPKHRYLYILGNKAERRRRMNLMRLPILPYPKKTGGDAIACKQTTSPPPDSTTQGGAVDEQCYSPNSPDRNQKVPTGSGLSALQRHGADRGTLEGLDQKQPEPGQSTARHFNYGYRYVGS